MMNNIKKLILSVLFLPLILLATTKDEKSPLAVFYTVDGNIENQYNMFARKKLKNIGFILTDPHKRVNDQYETKYGSTVLDLLSFMPVVNDDVILPLLNIDPRIAGFAPFNMLIYKKLDENTTHIGHLEPSVMLDILEIEDKEVREKFTATFKPLDESIEKEFDVKKTKVSYSKLPKKTMINFEYKFETPEDMDEFVEGFQNDFEMAFINKGYLIAGFHNFIDATDNSEEILKDYDAFWTYSLCHLEFSYGMFDKQNAHPEAGLFAPCTMYMYIKKGTNTIVVGMFRLQNWSDTLGITDKDRLGLVHKLDKEIPQILKDFGMRAISNKKAPPSVAKSVEPKKPQTPLTPQKPQKSISIPTVPTVPKAISFGNSSGDRTIKFSKRVPPNYTPHSFDKRQKMKKSTNTRIGEVNKGRISAYLRGTFIDVKSVKAKLKKSGFDVIATVPLDKKKTLLSVVFTDKSLIEMASKHNRGFMASLRVLVDKKEKTISITNPLYLAKGFLQKDFDEKSANKILIRLIDEFKGLKNSKDVLKFQLLAKYQFMNGMPHYEDMIEVASGDDLLERIEGNKKVLFKQVLNDGSVLVGIALRKRTNKFTKKIGRNNAGMLPYPVLIANGKARMLDPKYYISYMYPLLKMSEFMTIATIPDAMVKDCERALKKRKKKKK